MGTMNLALRQEGHYGRWCLKGIQHKTAGGSRPFLRIFNSITAAQLMRFRSSRLLDRDIEISYYL
jgi:hypothetical protein